jgi:hypothetical protein
MIRRLAALSRQEWLDLPPALLRLSIIRLSLIGSIAATRERFGGAIETPQDGRDASPTSISPSTLAPWQRRALALRRVSRFVPSGHCLSRALALRWWMRESHLDALIVIGVRRTTEGIASHAWVELDGQPVDESEQIVERFQVISQDHIPAGRWTR